MTRFFVEPAEMQPDFLVLGWDSKGRHQSADWCKKCPVDTF